MTMDMDPDRRVEQAKESFTARAEELNRRLRGVRARIDEVRQKIDLKSHIAARPLVAVGIAFSAGALLGLAGGKRHVVHEGAIQRRAGSAIAGALGALVMSLVRSYTMSQLTGVMREWYEGQVGKQTSPSYTEHVASYQPETESFARR